MKINSSHASDRVNMVSFIF